MPATASIDMQARAIKALRRTNQIIGLDLGWNEKEPPPSVVREVCADKDYLELFGNDREAASWFRKLDRWGKDVVLKTAFH